MADGHRWDQSFRKSVERDDLPSFCSTITSSQLSPRVELQTGNRLFIPRFWGIKLVFSISRPGPGLCQTCWTRPDPKASFHALEQNLVLAVLCRFHGRRLPLMPSTWCNILDTVWAGYADPCVKSEGLNPLLFHRHSNNLPVFLLPRLIERLALVSSSWIRVAQLGPKQTELRCSRLPL